MVNVVILRNDLVRVCSLGPMISVWLVVKEEALIGLIGTSLKVQVTVGGG